MSGDELVRVWAYRVDLAAITGEVVADDRDAAMVAAIEDATSRILATLDTGTWQVRELAP